MIWIVRTDTVHKYTYFWLKQIDLSFFEKLSNQTVHSLFIYNTNVLSNRQTTRFPLNHKELQIKYANDVRNFNPANADMSIACSWHFCIVLIVGPRVCVLVSADKLDFK